MQMFKKSVNEAIQGDRVGILVTDFNSESLERGVAAKPGYLKNHDAVLISVHKIKYYKNPIEANAKFHISIGHNTGKLFIKIFISFIILFFFFLFFF